MSAESYVDSIRHHLVERNEKVRIVVDILRRIVRSHAEFDHHSQGSRVGVPSALWNQEKPQETVWLGLYNRGSEQIDQADVDIENKESAVGFARFRLCEAEADSDHEVMIIETSPPNVRGYDGAPLNSSQLSGAITDLQRYEHALNDGRFE